MSSDVSPRPYKSPRRETAATRTREEIVKTAVGMLGTADGIGGFSLEAVARKAGVPRLTIISARAGRCWRPCSMNGRPVAACTG